jgi:hypothetical protein
MTSVLEAGWLALLAALWQADGLQAWTLKLVGVLFVVLALTGLMSRGGGKSAVRAVPVSSSPRPRGMAQSHPPKKNLKKKPERIVRRYRPVSHTAPLRPASRRSAPLTLVAKSAARPGSAPALPVETRASQPAKVGRTLF